MPRGSGDLSLAKLRQVEKTWREYRNYTLKQAHASDFLTNQGIFALDPKVMTFCLYGGAGYGGKSYWLRSLAFELCMVLRDLGFKDQWGALFCQTYPDLQQRHIAKFKEEMAGLGTVSETHDRGLHIKWHGEGMGGVYFKNVVSADGVSKGRKSQRGSENAFALIEEATEMEEEQIGKIMYTVRSARALPFSARALATNPDGPGHRFCKEIFVPEFRDLDHPLFKKINPKYFYYVPALKADNPAYEENKEVVDANMAMETDPEIRKAREEGSWNLYLSGRFSLFTSARNGFSWEDLFEAYAIPEDYTPETFLLDCHRMGFEIYGSLDYGTSEKGMSSYYLHLVGPDSRVWTFRELDMPDMQLPDQVPKIKRAETVNGKQLQIRARYADPYINGKAGEDQSGLTRADKFRLHGLHFELGVNDRVEGAGTVEAFVWYRRDEESGAPLSWPRWRIHRANCPGLMKEIPALPRDKHNPEDVDKKDGKWHRYDSCRYFLHTRFTGGFIRVDGPREGSGAYYNQLARNQKVKRDRDYSRWGRV